MAKYFYCDYITTVIGSRSYLLERKLVPFVSKLLYHKIVAEDDIENMVEIIRSEQSLIRRKFPRLRPLDIFSADSNLPDRDHKFIHFGDCYARLEPVLNSEYITRFFNPEI